MPECRRCGALLPTRQRHCDCQKIVSRVRVLHVRVTVAEWEGIRALAASRGVRPATWLRRTLGRAVEVLRARG